MLSADEIKDRLSTEDIIRFMEYFGADIGQMTEEYITFLSICHGSTSHKFYYYPQTKSFFCFVCGNIDIFTIVQQEENLTFNESIEWVMNFFNLNKKAGFGRPKKVEHKPREMIKKEINIDERLPSYYESILNTFIDYKPIEWLKEGISKDVMDLFEVRYDINSHSIIIPCRDMFGSLVGIRTRNLDEKVIEEYGKYGLFTDSISKIPYKCLTGRLLYGLNINKDKIQETKMIVLVEGEKSVLKAKTWFGDNDITVASFGANLTNYQIEIIKSLGVTDVIFAYDKEIDDKINDKIKKVYKKCSLIFNVYYIEDTDDLLKEKDSPLDRGLDVYRKLLDDRKEFKIINN